MLLFKKIKKIFKYAIFLKEKKYFFNDWKHRKNNILKNIHECYTSKYYHIKKVGI